MRSKTWRLKERRPGALANLSRTDRMRTETEVEGKSLKLGPGITLRLVRTLVQPLLTL